MDRATVFPPPDIPRRRAVAASLSVGFKGQRAALVWRGALHPVRWRDRVKWPAIGPAGLTAAHFAAEAGAPFFADHRGLLVGGTGRSFLLLRPAMLASFV